MAQIPRHRQAASSGLFFLLVVGLAATCVVTPQVADAQRGDADVLVAQAVLAYEDQNYEKAFDLLNRALQFEPQNARGLYYLGLVRLARQEPEQAIAPLEMLRSIRPTDPQGQYQLGIAYFSVRDYDRADACPKKDTMCRRRRA